MDPRRITEVFAMHGNEMTTSGHDAVVEHLMAWPAADIVEFQETLVRHLVEGTWTRTSINRVIQLESGGQWSRGPNPWTEAAEIGSAEIDFVALRDEFDRALAVPGMDEPVEVPRGHVGLPLHPWTGIPGQGRGLKPAAVRRAILAEVESPSQPELELLLRAAPWAYFRKTGELYEGAGLSWSEGRRIATEPWGFWSRRLRVERGNDRADLVQVYGSWTGVDSFARAKIGLERLIRTRLKASLRVLGEPQRVSDAPSGSGHLPDGQLVWRGPAVALAEPSALIVALADAFTARPQPVTPMPDDQFWALITALGTEGDDWESLSAALSRKAKTAIIGFHETLAAKLNALDLPSLFHTDSDEMPMSEDVFLYVRCAVVAAGEEAYQRVLREGVLRQEEWGEGEAEMLLSIAPEAYATRTGEELDHETAVSYETGSNPAWESAALRPRDRFVGFSVRSWLDGAEEIRFWRTPERAVAIERQRAAVPGAVDEETVFGVVDHSALPIALALSGIAFGASVAP